MKSRFLNTVGRREKHNKKKKFSYLLTKHERRVLIISKYTMAISIVIDIIITPFEPRDDNNNGSVTSPTFYRPPVKGDFHVIRIRGFSCA